MKQYVTCYLALSVCKQLHIRSTDMLKKATEQNLLFANHSDCIVKNVLSFYIVDAFILLLLCCFMNFVLET